MKSKHKGIRTALILILFLGIAINGYSTFAGTYTVDPSSSASSTNYKDLKSILSDLRSGFRTDGGSANGAGVTSKVTINIENGTYTGAFRIGDISGLSATNTLTIQSKSQDSSKVILRNASSNSSTVNYTLAIDSADYIRIRYLTIERTGTNNYGRVLVVENGACNDSVSNCRINGVINTSITNEFALIYQNSNASSTLRNNSNSYVNNYLQGGSVGILVYGNSNYVRDQNIIITNNTFYNCYQSGILQFALRYVKINNNVFKDFRYSDVSIYYAVYIDEIELKNNRIESIYVDGFHMENCSKINIKSNVFNAKKDVNSSIYTRYCDNLTEISNNIINHPGESYYGIYLSNVVGGTNSKRGLIYNNSIYVGGSTVAVVGLYLDAISKLDILFNTIHNKSSTKSSAGIYGHTNSNSNTNNNLINNAIIHTGKGQGICLTAYALIYKIFLTSEYNDIWAKSGEIGAAGTTICYSIQDWRTATKLDSLSISIDPRFSTSQPTRTVFRTLDGKAKYTYPVITDIDGDTRTGTPDIGADEYTPIYNNLSVDALLNPNINDCGDSNTIIKVGITNVGSINIINPKIKVEISGVLDTVLTDSLTKTLSANTSDTITLSYKLNTWTGGNYTFKITGLLSGDSDNTNDVITKSIIIRPRSNVPTGVKGATRNGYGSVTLKVDTAGKSGTNLWFNSMTATAPLAKGDSFLTPKLCTTTTYFVAKNSSVDLSVGPKTYTTLGTVGAGDLSYGLKFNAYKDISIDTFTVYADDSGYVIVTLYDPNLKLLVIDSYFVSHNKPGTFQSKKINVNMIVNQGNNYQISAKLFSTRTKKMRGLYKNTIGANWPYEVTGVVGIIGNLFDNTGGSYYHLYDWKVSTFSCASARVPVTATLKNVIKPIASITQLNFCLTDSIEFKDNSTIPTGYNITQVLVDFGDGSKQIIPVGKSFKHLYKSNNSYKVKASVIATSGCGHDTTISLVSTAPIAKLILSRSSTSCDTGAVTFYDSTIYSGAYTRKWNYPVKNLSGNIYEYRFPNFGNYILSLKTTANGCSDTTSVKVKVFPKPSGYFSAIVNKIIGYAVFEAKDSKGSNYEWDFGDAKSGSGAKITHRYYTNGNFTVKLTYYDANGCFVNKDTTVTVTRFSTNINHSDYLQTAIKLFPNPTSNLANIQYTLIENTSVNIQLMDVNGKLVQEILKTNQSQGEHTELINTSQLPTGLYIVRCVIGGVVVIKRLEVMR